MTQHRYLTTSEVAAYLRLKERKVYDLVRQGAIPCTKATGKLLYPRDSVDLWVMSHLEGDARRSRPAPPILVGSQDPLLDWAVRETGANLATLCHGSGDGVRRLLDGRAMVAAVHLLDAATGQYNQPVQLGLGGMPDLVMIHWASRRQGLVVPADNPLGVQTLADLTRAGVRVARRQSEAGADALLRFLLQEAGIEASALRSVDHPYLSEDDLALAVSAGEADAGVAVEAAARRHGLAFIPLQTERLDLAMRRRSFFEPAIQALLGFARESRFRERAAAMGGYDVSQLGRVLFNA